MGHFARSFFIAAAAAVVGASAYGCALNAEGEGLFEDSGASGMGGFSGGGAGGSQPDAEVHDVSVEDAIPDVPPPPDVPCFPPKKVCGSTCDYPDPFIMGCSPNSEECDPCPLYANAEVICLNGACALGACDAMYADCDSNPANGCETPINTLDDCGQCGHTCSRENASADCTTGSCVITQCSSGWADCDGVDSNGCEVNLHTLEHCGSCTAAYCGGPGPDVYTCATGECKVSICTAPLTADCDNDEANGCEVDLTTLIDCGACGIACSRNHAAATCAGGTCAIAQCEASFGNCDNVDGNGCETNISTSAQHCGSCGGACATTHSTNTACQDGLCVNACDNGWADCNGPQPGNGDDGCEVEIASDPLNCGGCGKACSTNNVPTTVCTAGVCTGDCDTGFADCNADKLADGCEVDLMGDVNNCGSCGHVCSSTGGTASCVAGQCKIACSTGRADCDGNVETGCEIDTRTDVSNCGACGAVCNLPHANEGCANSACTVASCASGWGNCNGVASDGCEVDTTSTVSDCGSCGHACNLPNANEGCANSACTVVSCSSGWANCNGVASDGCEIDTRSSVSNCGSCGHACDLPNANESCVNSACTVASCLPGWGNCDGVTANGCEVDTKTNVNNCGSCGHVCNLANANEGCANSACTIASCLLGWGNCNSVTSDGCETNTTSSATNCGACGTVCNLPNANETCVSSACTIASCSTGWGNCDGTTSNGCETNTTTSPTNCGACGTVCTLAHATAGCASSACTVASCASGWGDCNSVASDGCETDTTSTPTDCGACGTACTLPHATAGCASSACTIAKCDAGYEDCNGDVSDGCEANLNTDVLNCGACGRGCSSSHVAGSLSCTAGLCDTTACENGWANNLKPEAPAADDGCEGH